MGPTNSIVYLKKSDVLYGAFLVCTFVRKRRKLQKNKERKSE